MRGGGRRRGQAIFETALMMPIFLLAFYGLLWAMKDASLSERAALAVRYGGMVDSMQQPYVAYSLYNVYATLDNVVPAANATCYPGDPSQLTTGYRSFWLPSSSAPLVTPCSTQVVIISSPETYTQPVILRNNYSSISATAPIAGHISSALPGTTTTVTAAENFFRSPDVGTILTCTTLGPVIRNSLEGRSDSAVPTGLMNSIPYAPATAAVVTGTTGSCYPTTSSYAAPVSPY
jgi:hypothetical protein